jgi:hypothetical protein
VREILPPGKGHRGDAFAPRDLFGQMVGKAAGKLERRFGRDIVSGKRG